ncbi:MAG TPA: HD domain-containing phosphohydrolase [Edaphobacter sp.]
MVHTSAIQTSAAFRSESSATDGAISLSEVISALSFALDLTESAVPGQALQSCLERAVLDLEAGRQHTLESEWVDHVCEAFAEIVDSKSHYTFRHSKGVAETAHAIARRMGLAPDRVQLVRRAALLHDIGKLSLSNSILDKTSRLSKAEWDAVYQHPRLTRKILERVRAFQEIAIIAGEHHEKLDGSGYPDRLMAPDLSLESRIVAVADVYGALSEDRPYRGRLEQREIVSILTKLAPQKLDSDCIDALRELLSDEQLVAFGPLHEERAAVCA